METKKFGEIKSKKYFTKAKKVFWLKIKVLSAVVLFAFGFVTGSWKYTEWRMSQLVSVPEVHAQTAEKKLTPFEYVMQEVEKAGINKFKVYMLFQCENKSFSPEASFINWKNQAGIDRGLWMLNSIHHKEVSNACAYNVECSTKEAIRILKQRGFKEWTCGKDLGSIY